MKRPSLKKFLLSLSLGLTLFCYPYADVLPAMSTALTYATTAMMGLTAFAFRLLTQDKQQLNCFDIQHILHPSVVMQGDTATINITFSQQAANNKISLNEETQTITTAVEKQDTATLPQAEQAAPVVVSHASSINSGRSILGSTFTPIIVSDITQAADRTFGVYNQHNVQRTIELTGASQVNIPLYTQQTTSAHRSLNEERIVSSTGSYTSSHQQVLQEAQKNSAAIDNAVHNRQGGRMSEIQRNTIAFATIRSNKSSSDKFDQQYSSFLHNVELCAYQENKAVVFEALFQLANPENYAVLKQVPYLAKRFDQVVATLQHLCLLEDGSLRGGRIVGHEVEIARAIAEFVTPLNGAHAFDHIVEQLVVLKVPGAQGLHEERQRYYDEPYVFRIIDGLIDCFKDIFAPKAIPPLITQKFLANPFNQDMLTIIRDCRAERWDHAQAIADQYQAEFDVLRAKNIWNDEAQNKLVASKTLLHQLAYEKGIFKKYASHPLYPQLKQRPYPHRSADNEVNKQLEKEFILKDTLLQRLGVTRPSPLVEKLAYRVAPIFYNPVAVNKALSCLSKDHPDQAVREAYAIFFNEQDIYRLLAHDAKRLEGITLSECINNGSHIKTRVALNTLLKIIAPDAIAKEQIKFALTYVQQACLDEALKDEYTAIATAMCDAMIIQESDKTILSLGDFTQLCTTEDQQNAQQILVRHAAMICEKLSESYISKADRAKYQKDLSDIELRRKALSAASAEKYPLIYQICVEKFVNTRDTFTNAAKKVGATLVAVTAAEIIHNEIATPTIPTINIVFNESGQQHNNIQQPDIPPQPSPDPEDPNKEKKPSDIKIDEKSADHMFGNREGHIPDTPANRELLLSVANGATNFLGHDEHGNAWYAKILETGKQVWVQVWEKLIRNGGINDIPKIFNPKTGLSRHISK